MIRLRFTLLAAMLAVLSSTPAGAQRLETDLVLGLGDRHETEDFYRSIGAVTTDNAGRIYVSEYHGTDIRVYAADGQFLATLGSRGAAAGEFRVINALGVAHDGRLVVLDQINHRFTWFASDLASFEVTPVPGVSQLYASRIFRLSETEFLVPQSTYRAGVPDQEQAGLLRIYSRELDRHNGTFGRRLDFSPEDEMGDARLSTRFDYLRPLVLSPDSVLVGEEYHPGHLTLFVRRSGVWGKAGVWRGEPVARRYRVLEPPRPGTPMADLPYEAIATMHSGPAGTWYVDVWSTSRGLAHAPGGGVLHFSYIFDGRRGVFGVEEFSRDGTLLGYHPLQVSRRGEHEVPMSHAQLMHQDSSGRLYFRHTEDGAPVVRRMRYVR